MCCMRRVQLTLCSGGGGGTYSANTLPAFEVVYIIYIRNMKPYMTNANLKTIIIIGLLQAAPK